MVKWVTPTSFAATSSKTNSPQTLFSRYISVASTTTSINFVLTTLMIIAALTQTTNGFRPVELNGSGEGRKLFGGYRITPKHCRASKTLPISDPRTNGPTICMFNHECAQRNGEVVGACMDGFLFGACCQIPNTQDLESTLINDAQNAYYQQHQQQKLQLQQTISNPAAAQSYETYGESVHDNKYQHNHPKPQSSSHYEQSSSSSSTTQQVIYDQENIDKVYQQLDTSSSSNNKYGQSHNPSNNYQTTPSTSSITYAGDSLEASNNFQSVRPTSPTSISYVQQQQHNNQQDAPNSSQQSDAIASGDLEIEANLQANDDLSNTISENQPPKFHVHKNSVKVSSPSSPPHSDDFVMQVLSTLPPDHDSDHITFTTEVPMKIASSLLDQTSSESNSFEEVPAVTQIPVILVEKPLKNSQPHVADHKHKHQQQQLQLQQQENMHNHNHLILDGGEFTHSDITHPGADADIVEDDLQFSTGYGPQPVYVESPNKQPASSSYSSNPTTTPSTSPEDKYVLVQTITNEQNNKKPSTSPSLTTHVDSIESIILQLNGTNHGPTYNVVSQQTASYGEDGTTNSVNNYEQQTSYYESTPTSATTTVRPLAASPTNIPSSYYEEIETKRPEDYYTENGGQQKYPAAPAQAQVPAYLEPVTSSVVAYDEVSDDNEKPSTSYAQGPSPTYGDDAAAVLDEHTMPASNYNDVSGSDHLTSEFNKMPAVGIAYPVDMSYLDEEGNLVVDGEEQPSSTNSYQQKVPEQTKPQVRPSYIGVVTSQNYNNQQPQVSVYSQVPDEISVSSYTTKVQDEYDSSSSYQTPQPEQYTTISYSERPTASPSISSYISSTSSPVASRPQYETTSSVPSAPYTGIITSNITKQKPRPKPSTKRPNNTKKTSKPNKRPAQPTNSYNQDISQLANNYNQHQGNENKPTTQATNLYNQEGSQSANNYNQQQGNGKKPTTQPTNSYNQELSQPSNNYNQQQGNGKKPTTQPTNSYNQEVSQPTNNYNQHQGNGKNPTTQPTNSYNQELTQPSNNYNQQQGNEKKPTTQPPNSYNQEVSQPANNYNQQQGNENRPTTLPANLYNQQVSQPANNYNTHQGSGKKPIAQPTNTYNQESQLTNNYSQQNLQEPATLLSNSYNTGPTYSQKPAAQPSTTYNQQPVPSPSHLYQQQQQAQPSYNKIPAQPSLSYNQDQHVVSSPTKRPGTQKPGNKRPISTSYVSGPTTARPPTTFIYHDDQVPPLVVANDKLDSFVYSTAQSTVGVTPSGSTYQSSVYANSATPVHVQRPQPTYNAHKKPGFVKVQSTAKPPTPTVLITPKPTVINSAYPPTTPIPNYGSSSYIYTSSGTKAPNDFDDPGYFGQPNFPHPAYTQATTEAVYGVPSDDKPSFPGYYGPTPTYPAFQVPVDKVSSQIEEETYTSPTDFVNFPPVRHPNLNMSASSSAVTTDLELSTPAFVEDIVLKDKMNTLVHKIVESLQGNFDALADMIDDANNTAIPANTYQAGSIQSTAGTTAVTRKPTRKPAPSSSTRPKATTKRPVTRVTTRPPTKKPATTTRKPVNRRTTTTRRPATRKPTRKTTTTTASSQTADEIIDEEDEEDVNPSENEIDEDETLSSAGAGGRQIKCGVRPHVKSGRIVGGKGATFGEYPWQVLVRESTWLGLFTKNKCGGVLITNRYVITAAHCQPGFLASLVAVMGEFDISGDLESKRAVTKNVKRVIVHRQYDPATFENDLALLEMESPIQFDTHIVPICMPNDQADFTGRMATVTGWGRLKYGGGVPSVLQEVQVPVIENSVCQEMFHTAGHNKKILGSFLCAGYANGQKDSCEGDSGGPLVLQRPDGRYELAGTVSHGIKCAAPYLPGVYMRTTFYKPWLRSITGVK